MNSVIQVPAVAQPYQSLSNPDQEQGLHKLTQLMLSLIEKNCFGVFKDLEQCRKIMERFSASSDYQDFEDDPAEAFMRGNVKDILSTLQTKLKDEDYKSLQRKLNKLVLPYFGMPVNIVEYALLAFLENDVRLDDDLLVEKVKCQNLFEQLIKDHHPQFQKEWNTLKGCNKITMDKCMTTAARTDGQIAIHIQALNRLKPLIMPHLNDRVKEYLAEEEEDGEDAILKNEEAHSTVLNEKLDENWDTLAARMKNAFLYLHA